MAMSAVGGVGADQGGGAHRDGVVAGAVRTEQRLDGGRQPGGALGGHGGTAGRGPATERDGDGTAVHLGVGHPVGQRPHHVELLRIEPHGLARQHLRHRRRQRTHGPGCPVDALEQHRADRDRAAEDEPHREHRAGEPAGGVGHLAGLDTRHGDVELEAEEAIPRDAEALGQQALALGPRLGQLGGRDAADADVLAEIVRAVGRPQADDGREAGERAARLRDVGQHPVEDPVEHAVVEVEPARALGDADQQRHQHGHAQRGLVRLGVGRVVAGHTEHGRVVGQRRDGVLVVGERHEPLEAGVDVGPVERPVLVQRRPAEMTAGVEGERDLVAVCDVAGELAERGLDEMGDRATRLGPADSGARGGHELPFDIAAAAPAATPTG